MSAGDCRLPWLLASGLCVERRRCASARCPIEDQEPDSCRLPSLGFTATLFDLPFSYMGCVPVACSRVYDWLRGHVQHASADGEPKFLVVRCCADWQDADGISHTPKSRTFVGDIERDAGGGSRVQVVAWPDGDEHPGRRNGKRSSHLCPNRGEGL